MTKIITVRHAEAIANVRSIAANSSCAGLTDHGHQQASRLARRLASEPITKLWTSPVLRARQTAGAIARHHRLVPDVDHDLREPDYGTAEGKPWAHIVAALDFPHPLHPDRAIAVGAETHTEYTIRINRALQSIINSIGTGTTVIVGHGHTTTSLINLLTNNDINPVAIAAHNTGITTWERHPTVITHPEYGARWTLTTHNDTAHLDCPDSYVEREQSGS